MKHQVLWSRIGFKRSYGSCARPCGLLRATRLSGRPRNRAGARPTPRLPRARLETLLPTLAKVSSGSRQTGRLPTPL